MANSVDPDETARYEPSHLDLRCLRRDLCWSIALKGFRKRDTAIFLQGREVIYTQGSKFFPFTFQKRSKTILTKLLPVKVSVYHKGSGNTLKGGNSFQIDYNKT